MGFLLKIAGSLVKKAAKIDPHDLVTQQTGSDLLDIIKDIIF